MSFACLVTPRGPQHLVGIVTSSVLHTLTSITIKGRNEFPELTARLWVRRLINGLSPRSCGFSTRPVHVGSVVDEVELEQTFSLITSVFPFQHHSTDPPYSIFFVLYQSHYMYYQTNYQNRGKWCYCFTQLKRTPSHHTGMVEDNEKL